MSSSSVWVQLYYEDARRGRPTSVRKPKDVEEKEWNVDALGKEVKKGMEEELTHCSSAMLVVYPAGTTPTFSPDASLDPGGHVPLGTTSKNPLIVVAPDPHQTHDPSKGAPIQQETLERIERKLDDMATVAKGMSEATEDFTRELLAAKGIMFRTLPVCTEVVDAAFSDHIYQWGEKEGESDGQRGCKVILEGELLPLSLDGRDLGIFDVRALPLPEVREGKQKSNGFADLAIGDAESLNLPHTRDLTFGLTAALIELKTGRAFLKQGQLLLQLVALSMISNARQGVVVLGTDCAEKWRLVYFSKFNEVTIQQYKCGKKCLQDLTSLIHASTKKAHSLVPSPLPSTPETEFPRDGEHTTNTSSYLDAVAHRLAGLFPSEREALAPLMDNNHNPPSMIYL